jgi:hypothetical protein
MTEPDRAEPSRRHRPAPPILIALGAVAAVNAAAWFYFRAQQPKVDERTRDRLQPRIGS